MGRILTLLVAALVAAGAPAHQAQPVFRSATHLIVQTVTVRDHAGQPIPGLTAKDFVVTENGEPQQIAFVEYQALETTPASSVTAGAERPAPPTPVAAVTDAGVSIPRPGDIRYRGRRLLVLYFDFSNMPFFDQARVFDSADRYINQRMTAADMVAVMVFQQGRLRLLKDFTADRAALLDVIKAMRATADGAEAGTVADIGGAFGEDDDTFNLFKTDRQLAALQTAVTDLGPLPEIKTLIYLGSGGLQLNGSDNVAQYRATVNAAVRSNVTINPIDTRGLVARPPMGDASRPSPGGIAMFSGALAQAATTRQQQSQDSYFALAKDTGGRAMFDNNDLSLGIDQAARAVTGYYLIGYYTSNPAKDGRFRRVKVTLAQGLAGELAYRGGYYAAKEFARFNAAERERQLEEALKLEDPITDIPIAIEVNYFQLSSAEYFVPVSVRMPGSELTRPRPAGDTRAQIDMIGEVKDQHGVTLRNVRDRVEFTLDRAETTQIARRPIQYETGFTMLPGRYVIKILARDATTGRIGTFQAPFVVPNLERERVRLPISSVVLSSQRTSRADALFTVRQKIASDVAHPLVQDGRQLVPSVTRTFSASRPVTVFLQAYERDAETMRPLAAYVTFYRDGVSVLQSEVIGIETWDAKSKAVPIRFTVNLSSLAPGPYDCQVTVLDPIGARAAFWRTAIVVSR